MPSRERKVFYVKEAIDSVINIIGSTIKNKEISLHVELSKDEMILGHRNEFEQALLNIITNAKNILVINKKEEPKIEIKLTTKGRYTYLAISDNAGGITAKPIEKIFQPYFTTREDSGGTGIGLYMSKLIMEKSMGGILSVKNNKAGALFTIRLKRVIDYSSDIDSTIGTLRR